MGRCKAPGAFHELWLAHIVLWPAGPHLAPLGVDVQLGQRLLGPIQGGMQRSSSIDIPVPAACSSKTRFSRGVRQAGASVVARWLAAVLKVLRVGCTWCGLGDTGVPKATRLEEWVEGCQALKFQPGGKLVCRSCGQPTCIVWVDTGVLHCPLKKLPVLHQPTARVQDIAPKLADGLSIGLHSLHSEAGELSSFDSSACLSVTGDKARAGEPSSGQE